MKEKFEKIEYSPFDPEEELKKIRKISDLKERRKRLENFKFELFNQKRGIAELINRLIIEIKRNPDLEPSYFYNLIDKQKPILRLTEKQVNLFKEGLNRYRKARKIINELKEKKIGGEEIFKKVTGTTPKDKIDTYYDLLTVNLFFHNLDDYFWFTEERKRKRGEEKRDIGVYKEILVKEIIPDSSSSEFLKIIAVSPQAPEEQLRKTLIHEEQHAIWYILRPIDPFVSFEKTFEKLEKIKDKKEVSKCLEEIFHSLFDFSLDYLANEIIARYREGAPLKDILLIIERYYLFYVNCLIESFVLPKIIKNLKLEIRSSYFKKIYSKIFKKEKIEDELHKMIFAISLLEKAGYNRPDIISLLITEKPNKWLKWAKRLT